MRSKRLKAALGLCMKQQGYDGVEIKRIERLHAESRTPINMVAKQTQYGEPGASYYHCQYQETLALQAS